MNFSCASAELHLSLLFFCVLTPTSWCESITSSCCWLAASVSIIHQWLVGVPPSLSSYLTANLWLRRCTLPLFQLSSMVAVFSARSCFFWFLLLINLLPFADSGSESMPQCVKNCNRNFANEAALSRHRKNCSVLESVHQTSHELRRGRGIGGSTPKHTTKLLSRKERLQVSVYKSSGIYIFICHYSRHILRVR